MICHHRLFFFEIYVISLRKWKYFIWIFIFSACLRSCFLTLSLLHFLRFLHILTFALTLARVLSLNTFQMTLSRFNSRLVRPMQSAFIRVFQTRWVILMHAFFSRCCYCCYCCCYWCCCCCWRLARLGSKISKQVVDRNRVDRVEQVGFMVSEVGEGTQPLLVALNDVVNCIALCFNFYEFCFFSKRLTFSL